MEEFISEPIKPLAGGFDTAQMATAVPGLPTGFTWRDETVHIVERLEAWKQTSPEGGRPGNEVYLRRHYHRLKMSNGQIWVVYFTRQVLRGGNPRTRWFLFSMEAVEGE